MDCSNLGRKKIALLGGVVFLGGLAACSSSNGSSDKNSGNEMQSTGGSGGSGGSGGTATLGTCDGTKESSAMPITQACGTYISPTGTSIQLGPYGAMMDVNVGKGFETTDGVDATGAPSDGVTCPAFISSFGEDPTLSAQLQDVGTQPCTADTPNTGSCINMALYSVSRPANWPDGKVPVLTWGNGTCAQPEGYGTLLRYIASYGFFVVAANSREVGTGADLQKAIDFATAANQDSSSPYFGHLDLDKVGAMGHSQGCAAAAAATQNDARIKAAILFNGVDSLSDNKPYFALSGDMDITAFTAAGMATAINGASGPAAYMYIHNPAGMGPLRGHLPLMLSPERVAPASTAFWQMVFDDDATAKQMFVGTTCGLCGHDSDYNFGEQGF